MNSFIFTFEVVHRTDECKIHHFDTHNKKVYNVNQKSRTDFSLNDIPSEMFAI